MSRFRTFGCPVSEFAWWRWDVTSWGALVKRLVQPGKTDWNRLNWGNGEFTLNSVLDFC